MKRFITAEFIPSLLILLFAYTGFSKLFEHEKFTHTLSKSPLLSGGATILAWVLPLTELCVVLLLLFSSTRQWGLRISLLLLVCFTFYLVYMITSTGHLPCSCGGVISGLSWKDHIIFNLLFILLNAVAIRYSNSKTVAEGMPAPA